MTKHDKLLLTRYTKRTILHHKDRLDSGTLTMDGVAVHLIALTEAEDLLIRLKDMPTSD
jgi:hypothetical protein